MGKDVADIFQAVEYSRDRWNMTRMPWALLLFLAGLLVVVYFDPRPARSALIGLVLLLAGLLLFSAIQFVFEQMSEARTAPARYLAIGIVILGFIVILAGPPGEFNWHDWTQSLSRSLNEFIRFNKTRGLPLNAAAWMLIYFSTGWIAFALLRHFYPARPILKLSPEGLFYHVPWLRDLTIPWHEIQAVGPLEREGMGTTARYDLLTVAVISMAFYEQHILPKRGVLAGRLWHHMFVPRGGSMQMVLHHELFAIEPKDIREPVEARWKAFRFERKMPQQDAEPLQRAPRVYGLWSIVGSPWQAITLLVPLLAILGVLVDALIRGAL